MSLTVPELMITRLSDRVPCFVDVRDKAKYSIGIGQSTHTETVYIKDDPDHLKNFITDIIGYSQKDFAGAGDTISRLLPARHPFLPYLWASGIEDITPVGRPVQSPQNNYAKYDLLRCRVNFATPPYRMIEDGVGNEFDRFVAVEGYETNSTFVQQKNGAIVFSGTSAPAAWQNKPIPDSGGMTIKISRTRIKLLWVMVPDKGLFSGGWPGAPTKILTSLGTVNNATFMGYPAKTLLFESWNPVPRTMPVDPTLLGLNATDVPRAWDVQLVFNYFDPKPSGEAAAASVGWQGALCPTDRQWYNSYISGQAQDDDHQPYSRTTFSDIFKMNA